MRTVCRKHGLLFYREGALLLLAVQGPTAVLAAVVCKKEIRNNHPILRLPWPTGICAFYLFRALPFLCPKATTRGSDHQQFRTTPLASSDCCCWHNPVVVCVYQSHVIRSNQANQSCRRNKCKRERIDEREPHSEQCNA